MFWKPFIVYVLSVRNSNGYASHNLCTNWIFEKSYAHLYFKILLYAFGIILNGFLLKEFFMQQLRKPLTLAQQECKKNVFYTVVKTLLSGQESVFS